MMAKPRVEPLSRPAWERVEARLFERLDRGEHLSALAPATPARPATRLWAGLAALAAAAAVVLWWQAPASPPDVNEPPVASAPAEVSSPPRASDGAQIVTTAAPTRTTMGEATLTLAAESEVHVTGSDAVGWLVRLDRGEVACEVAPRRGRPPFVVQAGETQVTVVGTRFTVVREGAAARVSVREGHVQVDSGASHVSLGPGDSWPPATTLDQLPELDDTSSEPPAKRPGARRRAPARAAAGEQFEKAARLEATDPEAALGIYRKLVRGRGRWAPNALYAEARLELERGRRARSRELLQRYLSRYPSGANGSDVRTLLQRLEAGSSAP